MDSDGARLEKLINQCKSNGGSTLVSISCGIPHAVFKDVDVKVDALTKLQAEFESGIEVRMCLESSLVFFVDGTLLDS